MSTYRLNRRELVKQGVSAVGLALVNNHARAASAGGRGKKPNILFILADDLGYADVSCYGRREYQTPAIDRLAREGMRYMQAYANSAVCSATRAGLITGRYQNRIPIGLEEPLAARDVGLDPSHPTMPSLLRKLGYDTSLIGKWHLGALPQYGPQQSGYDHFWGFRSGGVDYFTHRTLDGRSDLWDGATPIERAGYMTDMLGEQARASLQRSSTSDKPFFMSLHFNAPHWPWEGPGDAAEARRLQNVKGSGALFDYDGGSMATFAAMVTRMDQQIGLILDELDRLGLAKDTIVVFTSDNGGERYSDTWPFTGKKTELLEGGLRIPAIIRWPGHVTPGTASEQVMISMDWLPTLLNCAGGAPDPRYPSDGMDLTFSFSGNVPAMPRTLCWRYLNMSQQACRVGNLKYLKILDNTFLFDVVADPLERANLKDRYPADFERLHRVWSEWNKQMLPLDFNATTSGTTGSDQADHFGITSRRTVERSAN